jgi:hypothetical protein
VRHEAFTCNEGAPCAGREAMPQTEFPFTLPTGYVDEEGNVHADGVMRSAASPDEILPVKDHRVQDNPSYLSVIVLSRVIIRLGTLDFLTPKIIESLPKDDFEFLQELYWRVNNLQAGADGGGASALSG